MSRTTYNGRLPPGASTDLINVRLIETIVAMHRHYGNTPEPGQAYHYMINPKPHTDGSHVFKVGILTPNDLAMLEAFHQPATPVPEGVDRAVRSYFAACEEAPCA